MWDRLLSQAEITVSLLLQSNTTPKVSAYVHMSGPFDYNKMPLAPMGCNVQVHEKEDKRGTWAYHSVDGWYLATLPEHYCTHKRHIKDTRSDQFSDTFQHKRITYPSVTPHDKIMKALAVADCAKAIKGIDKIDAEQDIRDMQRLSDEIGTAQEDTTNVAAEQTPAPETQPAPRVDRSVAPADMQKKSSKTSNGATTTSTPTPRVQAPSPRV